MSIDESRIRDAIFNTVLPAYVEPAGDLPDAFASSTVLTARVWPGQQIAGQQYGNAWSPTNPSGRQAATENLSELIDPIPNLASDYSRSGRRVEQTYSYVLTNARPMFATRSAAATAQQATLPEIEERREIEVSAPETGKVRTIALTESASQRQRREIDYANAVAQLNVNRRLHGKSAGADKESLAKQAPGLEKAARKAWKNLQSAQTPSAAPAPAVRSASPPNAGAVAKSFNDARSIFDRSALASLKNPGIQYHPSYLSPENWVSQEAANGWPNSAIPIKGGGPPVSLTLRYSRVDISRPWLVASLFDLRGWETAEGPGSLSTGSADSNPGVFALLPISLIIARDIVATGNNGDVLFEARGLQILAWISKVLPYSPPKP